MTHMKIETKSNHIDTEERSRRLAQVYALILSWPNPRERSDAPASPEGEQQH
jgi:hypothetical protein